MTPPASQVDPRDFIRDVPDFPKPGILFKDITPLLSDPAAFAAVIDGLAEAFKDRHIDGVAAAEARGFIFGAPLALKLGVAFIPIRKPGKLPFQKISHKYDLEYGSDQVEMHSDAVSKGQKILLLDDVLATGGTMKACHNLVSDAGGEVVACAFVVELAFLEGRSKLEPCEIFSLISY
ncbi:adenine phosphoribosyltransferase [Isosphaeraceae bacterium EP7]